MKQYFRNWWLFLCGFRWCFTRQARLANYAQSYYIQYKKGWGPWRFVLTCYWWDYGLACALGRGVQSLSRAFELFGEKHWGRTGGLLWSSVDLWERK